jgi:ATP-dependent RNA helicase DeaD
MSDEVAMTATPDEAVAFADLDLADELVQTLGELGYEEPTPIQREAVPHVAAGRDLFGQAATGTGKTAAFALPMLNRLTGRSAPARRAGPAGLVLVPTRELAVQVSEAIHRYGARLDARVLPVYGGAPMGRQIRSLSDGVDIVVATPGRALDLIDRGSLRLDGVATVVLDEADEMLDMGFAEDIEAILERTPSERQTVLFSATMPKRIERMARSHLRDPVRVTLGGPEKPPAGEAPKVRQVVYTVPRQYKPAALGRLLDVEAPVATIVFCRTRAEVDSLTVTMNGRGYRAEALHGGLTQDQRDRVMGRLRQGSTELLVATDVAARGLDVDQLTHVVNYDVPAAPEAYVHRIGRVGRAGREGVAITLAEPREHRMIAAIERSTGSKVARENVPTVADLRARRLELTRASLREALLASDNDRVRVVVESLSDEFDVVDIALAAVRIAHEASGGEGDDDVEIPAARPPRQSREHRDGSHGERPTRARGEGGSRSGAPSASRLADGVKIFIGAGRQSRVGPNDLVGAIANESSLRGRDIGAIEIFEKFSLVEVPASNVDEVISALRRTTLRGRRPSVRRDRSG